MRAAVTSPLTTRERVLTLIVFGVAVLAYVGSIRSGFVFDDRPVISQNPVVLGIVPLRELLFRDWFGQLPEHTIGSYRPLVSLAFWIDWRVSHHSEHYFHLLNTLLHGVAMALTFLVFRSIVGSNVALGGALLASVLAAPSEAVEGVVGRADLFETIAVVGGLAAHRRSGRWWGALASLAFGAALFSKESGVIALVAWGALEFLAPPESPYR
jgi:protein O-mannosyl-transferase